MAPAAVDLSLNVPPRFATTSLSFKADDHPQDGSRTEPCRLTPAYGLKSVSDCKTKNRIDLKRTGASIALCRSMDMTTKLRGWPATTPAALKELRQRSIWNDLKHSYREDNRRQGFNELGEVSPSAQESPLNRGFEAGESSPGAEESSPPRPPRSERRDSSSSRKNSGAGADTEKRASTVAERRSMRKQKTIKWNAEIAKRLNHMTAEVEPVDIDTLEDAFYAICASFDMDGDGSIDSEELVHIFGRCQLFDEWLTPNKVRNYFKTAAHGCNLDIHDGLEAFTQDIDYEDFESVLRWGADMKGVDFAYAANRVVRLSRKLCDGRSSDHRKLETVFDAFCKTQEHHMTPYEFATLCKKLDLFEDEGKFSVADVYSIFYCVLPSKTESMDFSNFMEMLSHTGKKLGIGEEVFPLFASAVSKLDIDEPMLRMVKLKIKHAACSASSSGWRQFFRDCDQDGSGQMDWDEFYHMCVEVLHLHDRVNHLKLLFEKLDEDDSGELSIDELIEFIEHASASHGGSL